MRTIKSEAGNSMIEMLIATALGGIILTGVFDLYSSSANGMLAQTDVIQLQTEAKSGMDYMNRELRLMRGYPTVSTQVLTNDTITFDRTEESGYSSGGNTTSTLWDTSKNWTANAYAPDASGPHYVTIIIGSGVGETHLIKSNTATALTLADTDTWALLPDTSSLYFIIRTKTFTLYPDNTLRYQVGIGPFSLLMVHNVTNLSFTQPDPMSVSISMTAQSQRIDPRTEQYQYYTLTDTVRKRN